MLFFDIGGHVQVMLRAMFSRDALFLPKRWTCSDVLECYWDIFTR